MALGRHVLFDGVASQEAWRAAEAYPGIGFLLERAARAGGATVLDSRLIQLPHPDRSKPDSPPGGTAWVGLDESHVTLHWYDHGDEVHFALDAFTCGYRADPDKIVGHVIAALAGCTGDVTQVDRFKAVEVGV